jgi:hypothetical protein
MVGGYFDYLMMSKAGSATTPQTATSAVPTDAQSPTDAAPPPYGTTAPPPGPKQIIPPLGTRGWLSQAITSTQQVIDYQYGLFGVIGSWTSAPSSTPPKPPGTPTVSGAMAQRYATVLAAMGHHQSSIYAADSKLGDLTEPPVSAIQTWGADHLDDTVDQLNAAFGAISADSGSYEPRTATQAMITLPTLTPATQLTILTDLDNALASTSNMVQEAAAANARIAALVDKLEPQLSVEAPPDLWPGLLATNKQYKAILAPFIEYDDQQVDKQTAAMFS